MHSNPNPNPVLHVLLHHNLQVTSFIILQPSQPSHCAQPPIFCDMLLCSIEQHGAEAENWVFEICLLEGESIILLLWHYLLFNLREYWLPETCKLFWRPKRRCQAQETLLMRMTALLMLASIHTIHLILQWLIICLMFVNLFPQPSIKKPSTEPLGRTPTCTNARRVQWRTCIISWLSGLILFL